MVQKHSFLQCRRLVRNHRCMPSMPSSRSTGRLRKFSFALKSALRMGLWTQSPFPTLLLPTVVVSQRNACNAQGCWPLNRNGSDVWLKSSMGLMITPFSGVHGTCASRTALRMLLGPLGWRLKGTRHLTPLPFIGKLKHCYRGVCLMSGSPLSTGPLPSAGVLPGRRNRPAILSCKGNASLNPLSWRPQAGPCRSGDVGSRLFPLLVFRPPLDYPYRFGRLPKHLAPLRLFADLLRGILHLWSSECPALLVAF